MKEESSTLASSPVGKTLEVFTQQTQKSSADVCLYAVECVMLAARIASEQQKSGRQIAIAD